jgi:hypothetical protein
VGLVGPLPGQADRRCGDGKPGTPPADPAGRTGSVDAASSVSALPPDWQGLSPSQDCALLRRGIRGGEHNATQDLL